MIIILITSIIAAFIFGLFIGAIISAGSRADTDQHISTLRWHLRAILNEAYSGQISGKTLEAAQRTLTETAAN